MDALILPCGGIDYLADIAGKPLLRRQLDTLERLKPTRVTVVAATTEYDLAAMVGDSARIVASGDRGPQATLRSLAAAADVADGLLVVSAGVLLSDATLARLTRSRDTSTMAYDATPGWPGGHPKVRVHRNRLASIKRGLATGAASGIFAGACYLDPGTAAAVFRAAEELMGDTPDADWTAALNLVAAVRPIQCDDVSRTPWTWVETAEERAYARDFVWPAIAALPGPSRRRHWLLG